MGELYKPWRAVRLLDEDSVEGHDVEMGVELEVGARPLHDRDAAALQLAALALRRADNGRPDGAHAVAQSSVVEAEQHVVDDARELAQQLGVEADPGAELEGKGEHRCVGVADIPADPADPKSPTSPAKSKQARLAITV